MASREDEPSAYPWRGSKYGRCRADHGRRHNQAAVCEAWKRLTRSYSRRPVFGRLMVFVWERIEEFVKRLNRKQLAAVENFGRANPPSLAQFIEFRR